MNAISVSSVNEAATTALAAKLAALCGSGDCLLLTGDLGAGKTSFARALIHALQEVPDEVVSPTFTLMQTYRARAGFMISHCDLYRLKSSAELVEIGFDDALRSGLTLVEWPQVAAGFLPPQSLAITIDFVGDNASARRFTFSSDGEQWQKKLAQLQEIL